MKLKRLYLTGTEPVYLWNGQLFSDLMQQLIEGSSLQVEIAVSPHDADIILFLEPCKLKNRHYIKTISENIVFNQYANKSYVYSIDDFSISFLPGVYVNLEKRHHAQDHTSACGYLFHANEMVESIYKSHGENTPKHQACFRGSINVPVRQRLIDASFNFKNPDYQITAIDDSKWFNHNRNDKIDYLVEMTNSKYVICPRGLGTTSYRLYETMQLGRVPIIISDQWVPPYNLDWDSFSIRIAEHQVEQIPDILKKMESTWKEMAVTARKTWKSCINPIYQIDFLLKELFSLAQASRPNAAEYIRRWRKDCFWKPYGLDFGNRLRRKCRQFLHLN